MNSVNVEFDTAKDDVNRAKHGVSLAAASGFDWDTAIEREMTGSTTARSASLRSDLSKAVCM